MLYRERLGESISEAVSTHAGFVRPFDEIVAEYAVPGAIPLDLSHVTNDRRFPIQLDDLTSRYDFGYPRYVVAHREFRKTYCRDVLFELELLFTAIHCGPPRLAIGLTQKTWIFASFRLLGRMCF
jgi:hypothetical protein